MPNTRVRFDGALLAGFIAGSAYQIIQGAYIYFQFLVSKYNAIYGSFAALPMFLLWLQISWIIVLVGAEISHAYQNADHMDGSDGGRKMSMARTRLLALAICRHVVSLFQKGKPAQTNRSDCRFAGSRSGPGGQPVRSSGTRKHSGPNRRSVQRGPGVAAVPGYRQPHRQRCGGCSGRCGAEQRAVAPPSRNGGAVRNPDGRFGPCRKVRTPTV